jgi:molecular chaperone DnaJ
MRVTTPSLVECNQHLPVPLVADQILDKKPSEADSQGMIVEDETVSIKIPAGVVDGMQLKFLIKEMMLQEIVCQEI